MRIQAPQRRCIAARTAVRLAVAMIGSITLPDSAWSGEGAEDGEPRPGTRFS